MAVNGMYSCPVQVVDCTTFELPNAKIAECGADYGALESEICDLWLVTYKADGSYSKPVSATPDPDTDWLDPANYEPDPGPWAAGDIVHLQVIGDKPLPEFNEITVAKRLTVATSTTHTLNVDVTDFGWNAADQADPDQCKMLNYELIRTLQSRPIVALWFKTIDGIMVGGPDGIIADVNTAGTVFGRGEGTLMTGQIVFTWESDCDPPAQPEAALCTPLSAP